MIRFDIDTQGTLARLERELAQMPEGIDRARKRALKKLATWLKRQVLREAAQAAGPGVTQKLLRALLRFSVHQTSESLSIWLGTNPIKLHYLGTVRWNRRMLGARVGRRLFPGTFSWNDPIRTRGRSLVMMNIYGAPNPGLPIELVTIPIHDAIITRLRALQPDIDARFQRLLAQELNYVLNVERARA